MESHPTENDNANPISDDGRAKLASRRKRSKKKKKKRRIIKTVAMLPTIVTLGNFACGFFAIVVASRVVKPEVTPGVPHPEAVENIMIAGFLIFLGMVFDALDGQVARLSKTTSEFGAELDSLCDLVTFGIAPGILFVKMCPHFTFVHSRAVWLIAATFAICVVLRLARFNTDTDDDDDHMNFLGLPSPAGAAVIAAFAIMFYSLQKDQRLSEYVGVIYSTLQVVLPYITIIVALLMVSLIPYPHMTNQLFKGRRSFSLLIGLIFGVAAALIIAPWYSLPILCCAYALYGPILYGWRKLKGRNLDNGSDNNQTSNEEV